MQTGNFRRVSYSTKEGIEIWHLLTCKKQEEQKILTICRKNLSSEALSGIFILTYDRMRKYEGVWHLERQILFPGSVFLENGNEKLLCKELGQCSGIDGQENRLIRLGEAEENFLKGLCGEEHHLEMSRGVIRKGVPKITEGPLRGRESMICRIDRHKRLAKVRLDWQDRMEELCFISAGLEITEKMY